MSILQYSSCCEQATSEKVSDENTVNVPTASSESRAANLTCLRPPTYNDFKTNDFYRH